MSVRYSPELIATPGGACSRTRTVRRVLAHAGRASQIAMVDRLLEPRHAAIGEVPRDPDRLLDAISAVAVDEKLGIWSNCGARGFGAPGIGCRIASDLHLHRAHTFGRPATELIAQRRETYDVKPPLP